MSDSRNFLRDIVGEHQAAGTYGGRVVTRFPPEPNGYPHIGHAKSIALNFGLARDFGGRCHLRMDDTNPTTESVEYVESLKRDVRWLGFDWGEHLYNASDYFERLYEFARELIGKGKAYVCSLSEADMRAFRGTVTEAGRPSPFRERAVAESLDLFARMRAGEFPDGAHTLRAKLDMSAANMKMRDPPLYRIRRAHHYRTGDAWCIYPLYDFAHCLSDAIEGITHSICTLEFENNRELYDWLLDELVPEPRPHQYEFARLSLTHTVLSKRKLLELVTGGLVSGWDDPRMPTLSGLRRRGFTPEGIRAFCEVIGVAKTNSVVDVALLESCMRDDLDARSRRVLCVMDPLRVVLTNLDAPRTLDAPYFPAGHAGGAEARALELGETIFIERDDFAEVPPKGWHRLAPGGEVRLRHGCVIRCDQVVKDAAGAITELRCTALVDGLQGSDSKPKGTLHWVDARTAVDCEVRLYDRLFTAEAPDREGDDWKTSLNPASLIVKSGCKAEPSLATPDADARYQFERLGFFCLDPDSRPGAPVFNRTVALRDSWAKQVARDGDTSGAKEPAKPAAQRAPAKAPKALSPAAAALVERHGVGPEEARVIAADVGLSGLFEAAIAAGGPGKGVGTLVGSDARRALEAAGGVVRFGGRELAELARLVADGTLTAKLAREVLAELATAGGSPADIIRAKGLTAVADEGALRAAIEALLGAQADVVARYRAGETKLFGVLVGELMRSTGGKANAKLAGELLRKALTT